MTKCYMHGFVRIGTFLFICWFSYSLFPNIEICITHMQFTVCIFSKQHGIKRRYQSSYINMLWNSPYIAITFSYTNISKQTLLSSSHFESRHAPARSQEVRARRRRQLCDAASWARATSDEASGQGEATRSAHFGDEFGQSREVLTPR